MNSGEFFSVTNIRTNVQNDFSEFEGLHHKMVSQKPFIKQEICHINLNGKSYNPTINSSILRYDSNCGHKPRGTSKPNFSSPKGYLLSITSISKI